MGEKKLSCEFVRVRKSTMREFMGAKKDPTRVRGYEKKILQDLVGVRKIIFVRVRGLKR